MLDRITPLILTLNEAPNIVRTLSRLTWAKRIVIVDSGSTDGTLDLLAADQRVQVFGRPFDTHAQQWEFGLTSTGIDTEWVLALDADYVLQGDLVAEMQQLNAAPDICGFRVRFRYCIAGRPIRSGAYPPVVVLYRRDSATYAQEGHTQRIQVRGPLGDLKGCIDHDDRKSLTRWLDSQRSYARQEADHLTHAARGELHGADRLRSWIWPMPALMFMYTYVLRAGFLDGWPGLQYSLERTYAELLLSLELIHRRLTRSQQG